MNNYDVLVAFSGIAGIIIGYLLRYLFSRKENRDKLNATLFAEYKIFAQELSDILKDIELQSLMPQKITTEKCYEIDNALGVFLYKYYLTLPQPVIEEINCLHECLLCGGKQAFIVKRKDDLPVLLPRTSDEDIRSLLEEVAVVTPKRNLYEIYQTYGRLPKSILLKCQARHVITVMHNCWNHSNIYEWQKRLPKKTIAQTRRR